MTDFERLRRAASHFDAALNGMPPHPEEEPLLDAVAELRAVPAPIIREAFRDGLRAELVTGARLAGIPNVLPMERRAPRRRRGAIRAAITATVMTVTGLATAAMAQTALPGDVLYPIKTSVESVQVALAGSDLARGDRWLHNADERLEELGLLLADRPDGELVARTRANYEESLANAGRLLLGAADTSAGTAALRRLADVLAGHRAALQELRLELTPTASLIDALTDEITLRCGSCSTADRPIAPALAGLLVAPASVSEVPVAAQRRGSVSLPGVTTPTDLSEQIAAATAAVAGSSFPASTTDLTPSTPPVAPTLPPVTADVVNPLTDALTELLGIMGITLEDPERLLDLDAPLTGLTGLLGSAED